MFVDEQMDSELENKQPAVLKSKLDSDQIFLLLLNLSLPTIAGGLVAAIYNTMNSIFIGRFVGNNALAALTVSTSVQIVLFSFAALFSVGTGTLISQSLGAKEFDKVNKSLCSGVFGVFFFTSLLSIMILIFINPILRFIGADTEILNDTKSYITIILYAGFVIPLNAVFSGALRAEGQARIAMILAIVGAVVNIILDFLLIVIFSWGIKGAAIGLVISQSLVLIISFYFIEKVYKVSFSYFKISNIDFKLLYKILAIGSPSGIRMGILAMTTLVANQILQNYGVISLAAFGIVNRIISLAFMPIQGCSFATQPIVAFNFGSQRLDRIRSTLIISISMATFIGFLGSLLFIIAPQGLFALFSKDIQTIQLAQQASRYMGSMFFLFGTYMILSGFIQAVGYVKSSLFLALSRPLMNIVLYIILPKYFGLIGVWLVMPLADILNVIIAAVLAFRVYYLIKIQIKNSVLENSSL